MTTRILGALLATALAAAGCSSSKRSTPVGPGSGGAGLGGSTAAPTGTTFTPPANVTFGTMRADTWTYCSSATPYGEGEFVEFCLPITYSGGGTVTVTFPAGQVFVSAALDTQNGIILQPVSVTVGPGTTTIIVRPYCLNLTRHSSFETYPDYGIGPDTNVAALEELIALVAGANESSIIGYGTLPAGTASSGWPYADYEGYPADWFIQDMVWTISEGGALSASDKTALAALP